MTTIHIAETSHSRGAWERWDLLGAAPTQEQARQLCEDRAGAPLHWIWRNPPPDHEDYGQAASSIEVATGDELDHFRVRPTTLLDAPDDGPPPDSQEPTAEVRP